MKASAFLLSTSECMMSLTISSNPLIQTLLVIKSNPLLKLVLYYTTISFGGKVKEGGRSHRIN